MYLDFINTDYTYLSKYGGAKMGQEKGTSKLVRFNPKKEEEAECLAFLEQEKEDGKGYSYTIKKALKYYIDNVSGNVVFQSMHVGNNTKQNISQKTEQVANESRESEDDILLNKFRAPTSDEI